MRRVYFLLLLLIASLASKAQTGKLFDTDNLLSSNFVNEVFQDRRGFVWIATRNGLNVYDGYRFSIFSKSTEGLASSFFTCFTEDRQGNVIVGTNVGLSYYDGKDFHTIPMYDVHGQSTSVYIKHLLRLRNGDVLVSTSGFGVLRMHGTHEARAVKSLASLPHASRTFEDKRGQIWVVTEDMHLYRLEKNGRLTTSFAGLTNGNIMDLTEDAHGTLYVATRKDGIYIKRPADKAFSLLSATVGLSIHSIYLSHDSQLYIASNGQGVHVLDLKTRRLTANPFFSRQTDLTRTKVMNIIEDRQGNIWMSMLQKGVFMQPRGVQQFAYMGFRLGQRNTIGENCVNHVLLSRSGEMWVGTDQDGLYQLDAQGRLIRHHTQAPSTVMALCEDLQGRIWIGTYREGCGYLDRQGSWHAVDLKEGRDVSVLDIKCARDGTMWFGTLGNGLVRLSPDGTLKSYHKQPNADQDTRINSLPNDFVTHLSFSHDQRRLYVGTCFGLACLDIASESWTSTYATNSLHHGTYSVSVYADRAGRVWYSTNDSLFCHEPAHPLQPRLYTTANGLTSNAAASLTEDALGRIWIGTPHGLCCLDPKTGRTDNFYMENGIQSNEFSDRAVSSAHGGRLLLFGGTGGINWFDPLKVGVGKWQATVSVADHLLGNRFEFDHDESSFTLRLSTLTYGCVEQIAYAYSINGEPWITTLPGHNEITFSHLPAGHYKFRVKALNNNQETAVKEFTITVHPAWYASWWAKAIYLCLALALAYIYIMYRRKKEEDRLLLQQHIHAEEMGEAKIRFFMNISHEIRTPLTLILTPLLSLIKDDRNPTRQAIYDMMRKNSERILHLINQMMDLRKIDKGQMVMHMRETDMVEFIAGEHELFQQQAVAKSIDFRFDHDCQTLPVWIDRDNFDKVLMNVLSNAFKFTPSGGQIVISLRADEQSAIISVKDSGMGIPKDKLETIFQRFYQSAPSSDDRNMGTGIGLDLTRSLVELHYGTIIARSNEDGKGSEFVITLPLGCEHLKEEERQTQQPHPRPLSKERGVDSLEGASLTDVADSNENPLANGCSLTQENSLSQESISLPSPWRGVGGEAVRRGAGGEAICLVEDDDDILNYLQAQLSKDYRVITFHNGKDALHEIIRQQPALVISDIMMPEMDGTTLCCNLKRNISTNHIPVILLTAKTREEDQLEGLETGADAYITKPFNMDILRRTILNLLSLRTTLRNKFTGSESQSDKVEQVTLASPDDKLMERIMQVVNENLSDSDLSVDDIANKVGISRVHLHRKMKELTNQTPHTFIRNIRLRQAAHLLRDKGQSVTEVMYACGFNNAASFSTMFKSLYGVSPREYKNT